MSNSEIKAHVLSIIKDIENGVLVTQEDINDGLYDDGQYEAGDIISGMDYISDTLDINWVLNSDRSYRGARLLVAFGGPNIYIDTVKNTVEGYWWGDSYTESFTVDAMDIQGQCQELYECC
jgi:hypothetical protein